MGWWNKYSKEEDAWLAENYIKYRDKTEMTIAFNEKFGTNRKMQALKCYASNHGYSNALYTKEEDDWLRETAEIVYSRAKVAKMFNKRFNKNKTEEAIRSRCTDLGIKFKGKRPSDTWNVGISGKEIAKHLKKKTLSRKHKTGDIFQMGDEMYILLFDDPNIKFKDRIKKYSTYVWEQHNGLLKEGEHVYHLDRNKLNNDISNLIAMSSEDWCSLMANDWIGSPEMIAVGKKYRDLVKVIKNAKEKVK